MCDSSRKEWFRDERREVYLSMRDIYKYYLRYLLLSAVGAAAIAGVCVTLAEAEALETDNPIVLGIILLVPFLTVSWAGGWAYLNLELWAHRNYLAYLDDKLATPQSGVLCLYRDVFRKAMYNARPPHGPSYTNRLNAIVAFFPGIIGAIALLFAAWTLWTRWHPWGIALAVAYVGTVGFLYVYVLVVKMRISERMDRVMMVTREQAGESEAPNIL